MCSGAQRAADRPSHPACHAPPQPLPPLPPTQALVTRQGPIEALQSHLSSPFTNNFVGSIANMPNVIGN